MSYIGKKGPLLKSMAPAAWLICLLLFGGIGAYAQESAEPTLSQSEEAEVEVEDVAQNLDTGEEIPTSEEAIELGRQLFNGNCKVCHALNEVVVGPALAGVHERRPKDWLHAFIRNSQQVIQSGDAYAVNLFNEYNKTQMPPFNTFEDEELDAILAYIKSETDKPVQSNEPAPGLAGQESGGGTGDLGVSSDMLALIAGVLIFILLLVLVVLILVVSVLIKYLNKRTDLDETDKEIITNRLKLGDIVRSRPFLFVVIFLFTAIVAKTVLDGLFTVGVQQGYQPEQPIAFSHSLHAGTYQINCNYCHTGVYKGKSANIPSVNICMNCHNTIQTESPEIQKLYSAVENDSPIEWVRIHNLPDLAYFNHSQHANVGGLDCQTCHGPIQEMEVVYQYSELTMGWCINCHRETELKTEGNDYYDKLVQLHDEHTGEPFRVKDIGGLECSKCHY